MSLEKHTEKVLFSAEVIANLWWNSAMEEEKSMSRKEDSRRSRRDRDRSKERKKDRSPEKERRKRRSERVRRSDSEDRRRKEKERKKRRSESEEEEEEEEDERTDSEHTRLPNPAYKPNWILFSKHPNFLQKGYLTEKTLNPLAPRSSP